MKQWSQSSASACGPFPCVNAAMQTDHLEIYPITAAMQSTHGNGGANMVSHYEFLPTGTHRYYIEFRASTGTGTFSTTWSALWFFAGNESGSTNNQSEFDLEESWNDINYGNNTPSDTGCGLTICYNQYFASTGHSNSSVCGSGACESIPSVITITNTNINTGYNIFGAEIYVVPNSSYAYCNTTPAELAAPCLAMDVYFNGVKTKTAAALPWESTNPAIIIGWNPGQVNAALTDPVQMIDYVRVWFK
jgi:hypothetical protein